MKELKELISKINREENFERKQGMLEMINLIYGTRFGFLGGRVVMFDNPDASVSERYAHCYDAWAKL